MLTSPKKPIPVPKLLEEQRMKEERMHDVLLLLQHLIEREETTVRMILDCLYDVGSVNLINQKITIKPANRLMKGIAILSKPAFRMVALRWFKGNCPQLITKWLYTKVRF
ncbi:MAG: hypothetical protein ACLFT0_07245 [Spirulinaceae cyanobacterium]